MSLPDRITNSLDTIAQTIAVRLPNRVKYWATMQNIAQATRKYPDHVMGVSLQYILDNMPAPKGK
jgi:hypothetical protein